jgi:hypothetical protein
MTNPTKAARLAEGVQLIAHGEEKGRAQLQTTLWEALGLAEPIGELRNKVSTLEDRISELEARLSSLSR